MLQRNNMSNAGGISPEQLEYLEHLVLVFRYHTFTHQTSPELKTLLRNTRNAMRQLRQDVPCPKSLQVAQLVQSDCMDEALRVTNLNFPELHEGNVEKILSLIYVEAKDLKLAIEFLDQVSYAISLREEIIFEGLYKEVVRKGHTDEPQMLLLKYVMGEILLDAPHDETYNLVLKDSIRILGRVCQGIASKDYSLFLKIFESLGHTQLSYHMEIILRTFYAEATLENTLLLVQFALQLPHVELQIKVVNEAFDQLKRQRVLRSEQAMHIWTLAYSLGQNPEMTPRTNKKNLFVKFEDAYHTLSEHHDAFVESFYRRYVDSPDEMLVGRMHQRNPKLSALILDFATFYFDGSLARTRRLLFMAQATDLDNPVGILLIRLYEQMKKRRQQNTFEAFKIFVLVKQRVESDDFGSQSDETKMLFRQLQAIAPLCVRQFLGASEFQLINRFSRTPLSTAGGATPAMTPTSFSVQPLASLTVKLLVPSAEVELGPVRADGSFGASLDGTKWMVKAHNENNIILFSEKGKQNTILLRNIMFYNKNIF